MLYYSKNWMMQYYLNWHGYNEEYGMKKLLAASILVLFTAFIIPVSAMARDKNCSILIVERIHGHEISQAMIDYLHINRIERMPIRKRQVWALYFENEMAGLDAFRKVKTQYYLDFYEPECEPIFHIEHEGIE
jgi:hypothetical protein